MTTQDESAPSEFPSRSTRARLAWMEMCAIVRGLVAQANREAGETVLCDDGTAPANELVIRLQDGQGFKLVFDQEQSRVICEFPHYPNFNRALEISARADAHKGKAIWTDLRTGAPVGNEEIAGNLVRNLLIMTSDS